jgi:hypothetical protein
VLAAFVLGACADAPEAITAPASPCSSAITLSVSRTGPRPTFDWTPRCAVSLVIVEGPSAILATPLRHWRLEADAPTIVPPLRFGEVPTRAKSTGFVDLTPGLAYRVSLFVDGEEEPVGQYSWIP